MSAPDDQLDGADDAPGAWRTWVAAAVLSALLAGLIQFLRDMS